ncbi:DUF6705 family protein [Flavobacterium sp.]|uniref:DUF6705 family protein n=1 Tax=Flavobacterium sp. TaxID=239 RepID=UPI0037BFCFE9
MKNILCIIVTILMFSCLSAQTVVDMANSHTINWNMKNGQNYLKDVNDYMLPYIGTWSYVYGNKEFRITLTKVTKHHATYPHYNINYYTDGFRIQYQKYENGILIYDSPLRENPTGIIKEFGKLNMSFTDYERNGEIFPVDLILIPNGSGQYNLKFKLDKFERRNTYYQQHPNEPYFSVPNDIVMTKM